jgi:hypothetical protein
MKDVLYFDVTLVRGLNPLLENPREGEMFLDD